MTRIRREVDVVESLNIARKMSRIGLNLVWLGMGILVAEWLLGNRPAIGNVLILFGLFCGTISGYAWRDAYDHKLSPDEPLPAGRYR